MRKAVTDGTTPIKEGSGRRYWMRAAPSGGKSVQADQVGKRPSKARFLEPYRFPDEHRAALLKRLAAARIGDRESRELFASAIEYDIANALHAARQEAAASPAPPLTLALVPPIAVSPESVPVLERVPEPLVSAPEPSAYAALAESARLLAEGIAGLRSAERSAIAASLTAADPFRRGYDDGYLDALCGELRRLVGAAMAVQPLVQVAGESLPPAPPPVMAPPPSPPPPPLSAAARRFIRRAARVYEEVLEARADPQAGSVFRGVLDLLAAEAGIQVCGDTDTLVPLIEGR